MKLPFNTSFPIIGQIYFNTADVLDLIGSRYCKIRIYYYNETRINVASMDKDSIM
jgi:hypothetical protein